MGFTIMMCDYFFCVCLETLFKVDEILSMRFSTIDLIWLIMMSDILILRYFPHKYQYLP